MTKPNESDASIAPATNAASITVATADRPRCRGVYCGVSADYEFAVDASTWVVFKALPVGFHPLSVVGARHDSGDTAPDAGDIVFLY